eukprot:TRINITY_DN20879_c0_g1_i1.p1 TRINITY_DN20879_c0_g1~~TRINITY_DN20879_c0_g1_i1.p1  ORF type:complete len:188 (-),score=32.18 TRINITY_DN20879_c0_g1_i1:12-575(-)
MCIRDRKESVRVEFNSLYTFDVPKEAEKFQINVHEARSGNSLGSFSMALDEVKELDAKFNKHWVTLFEDPNDDLYDGDYLDNDIEAPRVLISYEILDAAIVDNDVKELNGSGKVNKGILKKGMEQGLIRESLCLANDIIIEDVQKIATPALEDFMEPLDSLIQLLSLIHICRCRRYAVCRSRWSPYH